MNAICAAVRYAHSVPHPVTLTYVKVVERPMQSAQNKRIDKVMPKNHGYDHEISKCAAACKIMFKKAERVRAKQELAQAVKEARAAATDKPCNDFHSHFANYDPEADRVDFCANCGYAKRYHAKV